MRHLLAPLALILSAAAFGGDPPAKDALGDPLPKGAIARLGTERLRSLSDGPCQLTPDGKTLIAMKGVKLTRFDAATGEAIGPLGKLEGGFVISALSADASKGLSATVKKLTVLNTETGKVLFEVDRKNAIYHSRQLTPDGKLLAVGNRRNADDKDKTKKLTVSVFDIDAQKAVAHLTVAQNTAAHLLLSADGKRGVTWGDHYEVYDPKSAFADDQTPQTLLQFWDITKETELASARLPLSREIRAVAIAPGGEVVAASDGGGEVTLFDPVTGRTTKRLLGQAGMGVTLTFSPDGKTLAATNPEGWIQLWDVASSKSLGVTPPPVAADRLDVLSLAFTGSGRAVALARSGAVLVWEVPTGKVIAPLFGHHDGVAGVTFAAADKQVVTVGVGGEGIRWDVTGKRLADIAFTTGGRGQITDLGGCIVPPQSGLNLRHGRDPRAGLSVFDLVSGKQRFVVSALFGKPYFQYLDGPYVAATPDGKVIVVVASVEHEQKSLSHLSVIDADANTQSDTFVIGSGIVTAVAVTPDGKKAGVVRLIPSEKGTGRTVLTGIDLVSRKLLGSKEFESGWPNYLAATPSGDGVLVGDPDAKNLGVYSLTSGERLCVFDKEFDGDKRLLTSAPVFSSDGKRLACATGGGGVNQITLYDFAAQKRTHTFSGHRGVISCLAFSKDGKTLASGSEDTTVLLWDVSKE